MNVPCPIPGAGREREEIYFNNYLLLLLLNVYMGELGNWTVLFISYDDPAAAAE